MSKSRPQEFESLADWQAYVSRGGQRDSGINVTAPQDLFPSHAHGASPAAARDSLAFMDTHPTPLTDEHVSDIPSGFHVRVVAPRVPADETQPIIAPVLAKGRPPSDGPQPKRVLVVDDDAMARLYMRSRLMLRGHVQLLEAASGAQAMEYLMTQRFDAVLLDVDMGAQNGYEVCRAVRAYVRSIRAKQPRIYMITARSSTLDKMRAKLAGADAFLSKPPHPGELAELLAQL